MAGRGRNRNSGTKGAAVRRKNRPAVASLISFSGPSRLFSALRTIRSRSPVCGSSRGLLSLPCLTEASHAFSGAWRSGPFFEPLCHIVPFHSLPHLEVAGWLALINKRSQPIRFSGLASGLANDWACPFDVHISRGGNNWGIPARFLHVSMEIDAESARRSGTARAAR